MGGADTTGGAQTRLPTKPAGDVTSLPTSTSAQDEALSAAADASAQDEALSAAAEASAQAEAEADKKHSAAATTTIVVLVVLLVLAVGVAMAINMRRATAGNSPIVRHPFSPSASWCYLRSRMAQSQTILNLACSFSS